MRLFALALGALATLIAATTSAQTPDARDYEVGYFVPSKTLLINSYLRHMTGTKNRNYSADVAIFRATYILKLGDFVITPFDLILPVVDQRGFTPLSSTLAAVNPAFAALPSDLNLTLHATGLGDVIFLPTIGHGVTQNEANKTHTWYALTTYITAPTGKYDPARLLNVGQNRWVVNPLLMIGQRFWRAITLEAMGNIAFYYDNDEYRVASGALAGRELRLRQQPTLGGALHLGVDLHPMFFVSAGYLAQANGRRDILLPDGTGRVETVRNDLFTFRLSFGIRITPQTLFLAQWSEDVAGTAVAALGRYIGIRVSHALFAQPKPRSEPTGAK